MRSKYGVRVVELRESSSGMVVASRKYLGPRPPLEALVPPPPHQCSVSLAVVAEDSVGTILKYHFPTSF